MKYDLLKIAFNKKDYDMIFLLLDCFKEEVYSIDVFTWGFKSNLDFVKRFIDKGRMYRKYIGPYIQIVAMEGNKEIIEYFFKKERKQHIIDALFVDCAIYGNFEGLKLACEYGADINSGGNYALRCAAGPGKERLEMVKFLIEKGAKQEDFGEDAILVAIKSKNYQMVKILVKNGANVNVYDGLPLKESIAANNIRLVKILIENGADLKEENPTIYNEICSQIRAAI